MSRPPIWMIMTFGLCCFSAFVGMVVEDVRTWKVWQGPVTALEQYMQIKMEESARAYLKTRAECAKQMNLHRDLLETLEHLQAVKSKWEREQAEKFY